MVGRDQAILLDFDPRVTAICSQPFWLHWSASGRKRKQAPDFFARHCDGTGVVIDVRPDNQILETDPTIEAADNPQIIAITAFLAAWHWRNLPFGTDASIEMFAAEIVTPAFRWSTTRSYGHCDPLVELFVEEAAHRSGQRVYSYRSPIFALS